MKKLAQAQEALLDQLDEFALAASEDDRGRRSSGRSRSGRPVAAAPARRDSKRLDPPPEPTEKRTFDPSAPSLDLRLASADDGDERKRRSSPGPRRGPWASATGARRRATRRPTAAAPRSATAASPRRGGAGKSGLGKLVSGVGGDRPRRGKRASQHEKKKRFGSRSHRRSQKAIAVRRAVDDAPVPLAVCTPVMRRHAGDYFGAERVGAAQDALLATDEDSRKLATTPEMLSTVSLKRSFAFVEKADRRGRRRAAARGRVARGQRPERLRRQRPRRGAQRRRRGGVLDGGLDGFGDDEDDASPTPPRRSVFGGDGVCWARAAAAGASASAGCWRAGPGPAGPRERPGERGPGPLVRPHGRRVIYHLFFTPVHVAFLTRTWTSYAVDWLFDVVALLDAFLCAFYFGFMHQGILELEKKTIWRHHVESKRLTFDLLTCAPYEIFALFVEDPALRPLIVAFARLPKAAPSGSTTSRTRAAPRLWAADQPEQYLRALNWALPTLVVVVIGDVTPATRFETLYVFICIAAGMSINAMIIGQITAAIADSDASSTELSVRADRLEKYMQQHRSCTEVIKRAIALYLMPETYSEGDLVIQFGDHGEAMHFLLTGTVQAGDEDEGAEPKDGEAEERPPTAADGGVSYEKEVEEVAPIEIELTSASLIGDLKDKLNSILGKLAGFDKEEIAELPRMALMTGRRIWSDLEVLKAVISEVGCLSELKYGTIKVILRSVDLRDPPKRSRPRRT
ncbi:cyclic nucleotide-gated ion channel [Aureococcus anophagefferens]|nr:cyclic nucleotide-gated ion channel [Aureococcus anophagefferens]